MSVQAIHKETFKRGSKTYFNSSLFFPEAVRDDVFVLYAFVRTADNYVDDMPQQPHKLRRMENDFRRAWAGEPVEDVIVSSFVELAHRKRFRRDWVEGFLHAMELDLTKSTYGTIEETIEYMYGSAEVIGLFMAAIMDLPQESFPGAQMLGRAMQYINFLRDVAEDAGLGRTYLPLGETTLPDLSRATAEASPEEFVRYMRRQIDVYRIWQEEAERSYKFVPRRYLIPIKTAADMYNWTAKRIHADPFVVFRRKVKPSKARIMTRVLGNALGVNGHAP